jgi:membrane-associated phospholipid phosphatase
MFSATPARPESNTTNPNADVPVLSAMSLQTKLALGAGACAFLGLVAMASRPEPNRVDVAITRRFQRRVPRGGGMVLRLVSSPGYAPFTHSVVLALAANYWALGRRRDAIFSVGTMGAGFSTGIVKLLIKRPRPDLSFRLHQRLLKDNSFPSGHATHFTVFYGYVFFLARRSLPSGPLRTFVLAYCATLMVLVGPSRIYLGHHWASDVAAGQMIGLVYLLTMLQVYELFDPLPPLEPSLGAIASGSVDMLLALEE